MATRNKKYRCLVTLWFLQEQVNYWVNERNQTYDWAIRHVVAKVTNHDLGRLIAEADMYENACTVFVKSRVGYMNDRYPVSWVELLRQMLQNILTVLLDADYVEV